tara:strand:+ start:99 stop:446 length:348 start_codon:yes stop_codon:yes gene_type:complete
MANPRRRKIRKISERAAAAARAAGNEKALAAALAIASCDQLEEAEVQLSRVESLCAPKPKAAPVVETKAAPVVEPKVASVVEPKAAPVSKAKPKAKPKAKAKGLGSKFKKVLSKK